MGVRIAALSVIATLIALVTVAAASADDVEGGRALYRQWCARCHGPEARGDGPDASLFAEPPPSLRGNPVLVRHTTQDLARFVREGKRLELGLRPEEVRRHASRTEALYRYVRRLPSVRWSLAEPGRDVYSARCLDCHDDYGRPRPDLPKGVRKKPRDLSDREFQASVTDEDLRAFVRHGKEGMPALVPRLTEEETARVVEFVRLLSPGYELYDRFCLGCHGFRGEGASDDPLDVSRPQFAFDRSYFERHDADWVAHAPREEPVDAALRGCRRRAPGTEHPVVSPKPPGRAPTRGGVESSLTRSGSPRFSEAPNHRYGEKSHASESRARARRPR